MARPSKLFWTGVAATGVAAVTGAVLIWRSRRKSEPLILQLVPGFRWPTQPEPPDLGSGPTPPRPTRVTPDASGSLTERGEGQIIAKIDGPPADSTHVQGTTRLRPTEHVVTIAELPERDGTFEIDVCVSPDITLDTFTFDRILKWENAKRVRLFMSRELEISENATIRAAFNRHGGLRNLTNQRGTALEYCEHFGSYPTEPAFMYLARNIPGLPPVVFSWGNMSCPPGEQCDDPPFGEGSGSDDYRPHFSVFVDDGVLKLRIRVPPMPKLVHTSENQARVHAMATPYHYKWYASLQWD